MAGKKKTKRSGGQILIDALAAHEVDRVFGVPGESYLAALDAFYNARNKMEFTVCRQEGGAAYMAEAWAKLTGRAGVCFVTRGPGATNASIGVHAAMQDSTPMVLFIGQVARDQADREAFQEIDYRSMYAADRKMGGADRGCGADSRICEPCLPYRQAGRPGPVVLALPEDMLTDVVAVADVAPAPPAIGYPGRPDMKALRDMLSEAERPLMIVGGAGWTSGTSTNIQAFAKANNIPTGAAFRRQDCFDNYDPRYVGHVGIGIDLALGQRVREADLIIAVGPRLGEITTAGYTLLEPPAPTRN